MKGGVPTVAIVAVVVSVLAKPKSDIFKLLSLSINMFLLDLKLILKNHINYIIRIQQTQVLDPRGDNFYCAILLKPI